MATLYGKVNANDAWTALPEPALDGLQIGIQMISSANSGRDNNNGLMHIDKVADKRKFSCTWKNIKPSDIAFLISLVSHPFFYIKCMNDLSGSPYEGVFYAGDRSANVYSNVLGASGNQTDYSTFTVNFIER